MRLELFDRLENDVLISIRNAVKDNPGGRGEILKKIEKAVFSEYGMSSKAFRSLALKA